ncbi:hypothetical protein ACA910_004365 [Epithemia clementina (nom. ined.)]
MRREHWSDFHSRHHSKRYHFSCQNERLRTFYGRGHDAGDGKRLLSLAAACNLFRKKRNSYSSSSKINKSPRMVQEELQQRRRSMVVGL